MKAVQTKTASQAKNNSPFFSKNSDNNFFASGVNESRFFSKTNKCPSPIQAKLTIGQPNDKYELEADAMADKVVQKLGENKTDLSNNNEIAIQAKPVDSLTQITTLVQTKCAACEQDEKLQKKEDLEEKDLAIDEIQKKPIFESNEEPPNENNIQRKCAECEKEEKVQRKTVFEGNTEQQNDSRNLQRKCTECEKEEKLQKKSDSSPQTASPNIESSLSSTKGSGSPLPYNTREQMESSFGADFSGVRIHSDSSAVQMSKDLHAQAFTHGSDVYFNSGKYDGNSKSGKHLLAHELTHVVQQNGFNSQYLQRECITGPVCNSPCGDPGKYDSRVTLDEAPGREIARRNPLPGHLRHATNLERIARDNHLPVNLVHGFFVNTYLGSGATTSSCEDHNEEWDALGISPPPANTFCTFVSDQDERNADIFLNNPRALRIGNYRRNAWLALILNTLTHELQHIVYNRSNHSNPGFTCNPDTIFYISDTHVPYTLKYYLSELSAIISEFPVLFEYVSRRSPDYHNMMLNLQRVWAHNVENCDESIHGILNALRCHCSCTEVNTFINDTINFTTSERSWTMRQKNVFRELMVHNFHSLNWPQEWIP